jgi:predicted short-subunit dehydrogenase-like oxidoreductase (DUF2520 family)
MAKNIQNNICIIGAGRVGTTIAYVLANKKLPDLKIRSVSSRSNKSIERAKKILGDLGEDIYFTLDNISAIKNCNCILICTPDDVIAKVSNQISDKVSENLNCMVVMHLSGSKSLKVLESVEKKGIFTASIHPLKSFASIESAIKTIKGTVFGVTYSNNPAKERAVYIVRKLDGAVVDVDDNKKPLYHAAACVASNYLVSLINYAVMVHKGIGIKPDDSLKGLLSLIKGTIDNIEKMGTKKSLTGPIARGDIGTIREHLDNFNKYLKENEYLYKIMGIETAQIAYENKWINRKKFDDLVKLLKG